MDNIAKKRLNRTIEIEYEILREYKKLIKIERNNGQNYSNERSQIIHNINFLITAELQQLLYFAQNRQMAYEVFIELSKTAKFKKANLSDILESENDDILVTERLYNYFYLMTLKDPKIFAKLVNTSEALEIADNDESLLGDTITYMYYQTPRLSLAYKKALYSLLNASDIPDMDAYKYLLQFTDPELEEFQIENHFGPIPKDLIAGISGNTWIKRHQQLKFQDMVFGDKINDAIEALENRTSPLSYYIFSCCLLFLSNKEILNLRDDLDETELDDDTKERLLLLIKNKPNLKKSLDIDNNELEKNLKDYSLSDKEIAKLKKLLELSNAIMKTYMSLIKAYNINPNGTAFKNLLTKLALLKDDENQIYDYFNKHPESARKAADYFEEELNETVDSPEFMILNKDDEEELVLSRIIYKLTSCAIKDQDNYMIYLNKDIKTLVPDYKDKLPEIKDYETKVKNQLHTAVLEELENKKDTVEINIFAFYLLYLCPSLEDNFIKTGNPFPRLSEITTDLSEEDADLIGTYRVDELLDDALNTLYLSSDEDLETVPHEIDVILCTFKASLRFLSLEELNNLKMELKDLYESDEFDSSKIDKIKDLIIETIEDVIEERKKTKEKGNQFPSQNDPIKF